MEENSLRRSITKENEYRTNRSNCITLLTTAALLALIMVLVELKFTTYSFNIKTYACAVGGIIIMLNGCVVGKLLKFTGMACRFTLIYSMIIASTVVYMGIGSPVLILYILPLLCSGRYRSKKFCLWAYANTILFMAIGVVINIWFDVNFLHYYNWGASYGNILVDGIVPLAMIISAAYVAIYFIADEEAKATNDIIKLTESSVKMEADLKTGAELQINSLPTNFDISPGGEFEMAAGIVPSREVSGDFYDFFLMHGVKVDDDPAAEQEYGEGNNVKGDRLVIVIGDVSDKGLPAAMYMMSARNTIRSLCKVMGNPANILTQANKVLMDTSISAFVTMFIAIIDIETGEGKYVNAGHNFPIICRKDKPAELLKNKPQLILGAFDFAEYTSCDIKLNSGDVLALYTDGINESLNSDGKEYGTERLMKVIEDSRDMTPEMMNRQVKRRFIEFVDFDKFEDDRTLMILKWS